MERIVYQPTPMETRVDPTPPRPADAEWVTQRSAPEMERQTSEEVVVPSTPPPTYIETVIVEEPVVTYIPVESPPQIIVIDRENHREGYFRNHDDRQDRWGDNERHRRHVDVDRGDKHDARDDRGGRKQDRDQKPPEKKVDHPKKDQAKDPATTPPAHVEPKPKAAPKPSDKQAEEARKKQLMERANAPRDEGVHRKSAEKQGNADQAKKDQPKAEKPGKEQPSKEKPQAKKKQK